MFYYPNVLQRHSGCFSTIWLAATKGIRITRREVLKVNIGRTCEDIMDYVTVQVPPPQPNLPRPRFSLYLSSQLQFGVVVVYHRQCAFLLEEIQQAIERLLRSKRHVCIDMLEHDRLALNVQDSLFLLEEAEGAQDPFFGVMGAESELPSPCRLPQPWKFMDAGSPERTPETRHKTTPVQAQTLTVSPDTITIKEREMMAIPTAEFGGAELPEATAQEIDMLMQQQDQFLGEMEERERERGAESERTRELEAAMVSIEQLKETVVEDTLWLLDEETGRPVEVAMDMIAVEITPPPVTMPTTTEASERGEEPERETEKEQDGSSREVALVEAPPKGRGRRRQLVFADQHVQISQDAMREQIEDPLAETQPLSQVLLDIPPSRKFSSADLFSTPCGELLHPDLRSLWKRCAIPATLPCSKEQRKAEEESELSEMEREREVEEKERERSREPSIREVPRESLESGLVPSEASAASDILLDVSKEDKSQELITPSNRWSPIEEAPLQMEAIFEERVELPETEPEGGELTTDSLLRMVTSYLQRYGNVSFHSLLPLGPDRSTAARVFYKLLELVCVRELSVCQAEPYEPITITHRPLPSQP